MAIPKGGIIVPLVTPFSEDYELDLDGLRGNVASYLRTGVTGLMCLATTGEAQSLNLEERKRVTETVIEAASGQLPVLVGIGHTDIRETLELAEHASRMGAAGLFVITAYFYRYSPAEHVRYLKNLSRSVDLPIMVYNSTYTGTPLTPDLIEELVESRAVAAIKEGNQAQVGELARRFGENLQIFCGRDVYLLETLAAGGHGAIAFASNAVPHALVAIVDAWKAGDPKRALVVQQALNPLVNQLVSHTFPSAVKAVAELGGRKAGPPREPIPALSANERRTLEAVFERVSNELRQLKAGGETNERITG